MPTTLYAAQLADLKAQVETASERESAARHALTRDRYKAAQEVTADLVAYEKAIYFKSADATPLADRPARVRDLTDAFCDAVKERGLIVAALGTGGGVQIQDPALEHGWVEANAALKAAGKAVSLFERDHADDLEAERKATLSDRLRSALESGDIDVAREVLAPAPASQPTSRQRLTVGV
jgi:hypothetical protein